MSLTSTILDERRGCKGAEMEKPLAQQMFDSQVQTRILECQVEDEIIQILGKRVDDPDEWGFAEITFDDYDSSFELKSCRQEFHLTDEQRKQFKDLGFAQCWFCTKPVGEYDPGVHVWF